jgi:hypothetical protein
MLFLKCLNITKGVDGITPKARYSRDTKHGNDGSQKVRRFPLARE